MSLLRRTMKNHSVNVKVVRDQDTENNDTTTTDPFEGVEVAAAYAEIAKDLITHAALTIGGVYAACKIIGRICK